MSKTGASQTENVRVEYYDWTKLLPTLTSFAFGLAVAMVLARASMTEWLREPFEPYPGGEPAPRTGMPNLSLWLDLLCWVPALLVLFRRCFDRTYVLRFTIAHALLLAMAVLAVISTAWSADRFAAAVTGFHFLSAGVLCWSASQLVRSWLRLRFVAAATAALLGVYALQGVYYRTVDYPDNVRMVEKDKDRILRERGWTEDSFAWKQFYRKVAGGEMIGFGSSPNTYAAMLVTFGLIAAALAAQRWRDGDEPAWPAAIALPLLPAAYVLVLTNSKTGYLTPIIGAVLIWIGWTCGAKLAARRRTAYFAGAGAVLLGAVALIGHGLYHGSLIIDSLTFRWKYWVGSARVFGEHLLAGVGWNNFGYYYLAHRLPDASEEIKDPHNLFVKAAVELGILGLLLAIGFVARLMWEITRPIQPPAPPAKAPPTKITLIFLVAAGAIAVNALTSIDFGQESAYVMVELLKRLLYFGIIVLLLAAGTIRSTAEVRLDDRPAPLLLVGCVVALAMFLVHNLIDFSMWETGPMFFFALLTGALIGVRGETLAGRRKHNLAVVAATGVTLTGWLVAMIGFVLPAAQAESGAQRGDELIRTNQVRSAIGAYRAAIETTPISNADYVYRLARAMMLQQDDPKQVDAWLSQAIAANPMDVGYRTLRATFWLHQPPESQPRQQIAADYRRVIELDPNNLQARLSFAGALESWGDTEAAKKEYQAALLVNDRYHPDEPKRLSAQEIERIKSKL